MKHLWSFDALLFVVVLAFFVGGLNSRPKQVAVKILAPTDPATKEVWGHTVTPTLVRFKQLTGTPLESGIILCQQSGTTIGRHKEEPLPNGKTKITVYLVSLQCESGVQLEVNGVALSSDPN